MLTNTEVKKKTSSSTSPPFYIKNCISCENEEPQVFLHSELTFSTLLTKITPYSEPQITTRYIKDEALTALFKDPVRTAQ